MKRLTFIITVLIVGTLGALAQKNLAINQLFDGRYKKDPNVTVTTLRGAALEMYNLDIYKSLSITGRESEAGAIEALLAKDAKQAIDSEVSQKGGRLYYAFYRLNGTDPNRYILYLNQHLAGGKKIILMYLEGDAGTKEVKKMFKH